MRIERRAAAAFALIGFLLVVAACDNIPRVHVREGAPGEWYLIRRDTITATVDRRHPEDKSVNLYFPNGLPEEKRVQTVGVFKVITDDYEQYVPPVAIIVSATIELRTNGRFVTQMAPVGIDPSYPLALRRPAEEWMKAHTTPAP